MCKPVSQWNTITSCRWRIRSPEASLNHPPHATRDASHEASSSLSSLFSESMLSRSGVGLAGRIPRKAGVPGGLWDPGAGPWGSMGLPGEIWGVPEVTVGVLGSPRGVTGGFPGHSGGPRGPWDDPGVPWGFLGVSPNRFVMYTMGSNNVCHWYLGAYYLLDGRLWSNYTMEQLGFCHTGSEGPPSALR